MPWIIVHGPDGFCVHKQDEAGSPTGDPMGCHLSEEEAQSQVQALYANEPQAGNAPPGKPPDSDGRPEEKAGSVVSQVNDEWCIFEADEEGKPMGEPMSCHVSEEEAMAAMQGGGDEEASPPAKAFWMTLAQVKAVCVPCAQRMAEAGLDKINVLELSEYARALLMRPAVIETQKPEEKPVKAKDGIHVEIKTAKWTDASDESAEKGKAKVLGIPFGSRTNKDADGQYFTDKTDLMLAEGETRPVIYYHGMGPNGLPVQRPEIIGTARVAEKDDRGQWFEVEVDESKPLGRRIWDGIKRGIARASSGAVAHLTRIAQDGEILSWPVGELSLIDVGGLREPANYAAVALPIKSVYQDAKLELPEAFRQVLSDSADAAETASVGI